MIWEILPESKQVLEKRDEVHFRSRKRLIHVPSISLNRMKKEKNGKVCMP